MNLLCMSKCVEDFPAFCYEKVKQFCMTKLPSSITCIFYHISRSKSRSLLFFLSKLLTYFSLFFILILSFLIYWFEKYYSHVNRILYQFFH